MDDRHYSDPDDASLDQDYLTHAAPAASYSTSSAFDELGAAQLNDQSAPPQNSAVKPRKRVILLPKLAKTTSVLEIEPEPPAVALLHPESESFQRTVTVVSTAKIPDSDSSLAPEPPAAPDPQAPAQNETRFWQYLRQGNALFQEGKTEEAIAAYHQALQFNPESVELYQQLAQSLSQQGNLAEAASYYRKAIELTTEAADQAEPAADTPEAEEPLPWYEEAAFYLQQGKAHYQRQNWDAAIAACEEAVRLLGPKSAEAFHILGQSLQEKGRYEEAKQSYEKALSLQPQEAEFYAHMASVHAEQQQFQDAIGYYQKAIELDPDYAAAYWELGELWKKLGDRDRASDAWYRALQLQPDWANAKEHWRLGTALTEQGKLDQALHSYEQAVRIDPNFAEAYHNLGVVLGKQNKWQEALKHHRHAATLKPTSAQFWAGQGRTLIALENWDEAIACYQKVIGLNLNGAQGYASFQHAQAQIEQCQKALVAQSYYKMAESLAQQQQWQEAVTCYRQAIQRYPNQAHHYASLGKALAALNQWTEAIEAYQQAMELAPDRTDYSLAFGDVLIRREQLQKQRRLQAALSAQVAQPSHPAEPLANDPEMEAIAENLFTLL